MDFYIILYLLYIITRGVLSGLLKPIFYDGVFEKYGQTLMVAYWVFGWNRKRQDQAIQDFFE